MGFSLKEGLEKVYEGKPMTKMEKLIKRAKEYCRSCKSFKKLTECLELTDLEIAEITSTAFLDKNDIALIMTGYMPSITELVLDSQEFKKILNVKPKDIHSEEIKREFYKLRIMYLISALDEAIIIARTLGDVEIKNESNCFAKIFKELKEM